MLPSPTELTYFLEVARTLNLSRAAERIGISQPALTLAIKRLEDSLGSDVLIRSKSGVRLTKAGEKLVFRARNLFELWEQIQQDIEKDQKEIRGLYRIGCHASVAMYTLPHFIKKLLLENPNLELKLQHDLSRKITEEVISSRLDFGIVINPVEHPDLVIQPLLKDEVSFWVAKKPSSLQNPKNESSVLICDSDLLQSQSLLKQLQKKKIKFSRFMTTSNLEVVAHLVDSGAGIGILPQRVALQQKLNIKPLDANLPKFQDRCCLVYRADTQNSPSAKTLLRWIAGEFRGLNS